MSNTIIVKDIKDIPSDTLIVCAPWTSPLIMPDNVRAICSHCGRVVQHRPHVAAKLVKICTDCAAPLVLHDIAEGKCEMVVTRESERELSDMIKKERQ